MSGDKSEPELGSVAGRKGFDQQTWSAGLSDEPSLAAGEHHPTLDAYWGNRSPFRPTIDGSQLGWATGSLDNREGAACDDDREEEHDGREPDVDDELSGDENEPCLGSFDRLADQDRGWRQTLGTGRNWLTRLNTDFEAVAD